MITKEDIKEGFQFSTTTLENNVDKNNTYKVLEELDKDNVTMQLLSSETTYGKYDKETIIRQVNGGFWSIVKQPTVEMYPVF